MTINLLFIICNAIGPTDLHQYHLYTFLKRNSMSALKGLWTCCSSTFDVSCRCTNGFCCSRNSGFL